MQNIARNDADLVTWKLYVLLLEPQARQTYVVSQVSSIKYVFPPVEQVLSLIRELSVITKVCVPLLHSEDYCVVLLTLVVHKYGSLGETMECFPLLEVCMTPSGIMKAGHQG